MVDAAVIGNIHLFWVYTGGTIVLGGISIYLDYIVKIFAATIQAEFNTKLRNAYMSDVLQGNAKDYFSKKMSHYVSDLTIASREIAEKYCGSLLEIYRILWSFLFSIIAIFYEDWRSAIFVLLLAIVSVNLPKLFQKSANLAEKEYLKSNDSYIAQTQSILSCFLLVKIYGMFQIMLKKYIDKTEIVKKKDIERKKKQYLIRGVSSGVTQLSFILTIVLVMLLVMKGKASIGYVMSITQLMGGVMSPFEELPLYLMTYRTGKKEYEDIIKNEKKQQITTMRQTIPKNDENWIEMSHVTFGYSKDAPILQDLSLLLNMNKKYAIVGGSGEGKSTMAKLLMGFITPLEGKIYINGIDTCEVAEEELFHWLSYQEQHVAMLDDTIENNIVLDRAISDDQWEDTICKSNVKEILNRTPSGKNAQVGEQGNNLSGGEMQRIGLARSLLSDTKFLIFDEPTASLDNENALEIENQILNLSDRGVLVITHRVSLEIMEQYDGIFVLEKGKIVEQGTCHELLKQKGKFYRLVYGNNR